MSEKSHRSHVLVVDDHDDLLTFVDRVLSEAGYKVLPAASGEEALALARGFEGQLGLLVTDLLLPGITGGELREQIRELHPKCAAIYMSGASQKRIDELGLKYGATILRKPFSAKQLLEAAENKLAFAHPVFA